MIHRSKTLAHKFRASVRKELFRGKRRRRSKMDGVIPFMLRWRHEYGSTRLTILGEDASSRGQSAGTAVACHGGPGKGGGCLCRLRGQCGGNLGGPGR